MRNAVFLRRVGLYLSGGILTVLFLLAIAALTPRKWGSVVRSGDCSLKIYVSGGMMHTNLIVPVRTRVFDWHKHLDLEAVGGKSAKDYRYLQFGWGDRIFYMETPSWGQMSIPSAIRALILQNPAAIFVKGHPAVPRYTGEELKCISLSRADYLALMEYIEASFQADPLGRKLRLGSGQDGESGFYAATGRYSMLTTCNSWTANALRRANVNTPVWAGLAPAVMFHLGNGCSCQD